MTTTSALATSELQLQAALVRCRDMITVGSKSFSAASRLFGREEKESAFLLYGWCRFCDDQIDEASEQNDGTRLRDRLSWLRAQTHEAYNNAGSEHPVFVAFSHVARKYQIPQHYPFELLEGMAMDIERQTYRNFDALTLYCYRVAGVVGLMMSHIMGVSDPRALKHAADLGTAMQLTNIARDVMDDAAMGRVYLPLDWLEEEGIPISDLANPIYRLPVARVVRRLLERADAYYRSGDTGIRLLSLRAASAVVAARQVYSEIGREVLKRGPKAWDERVWISSTRKVWVMAKGLVKLAVTVPSRLFYPWHRVAIGSVWRHA